MKMKEIRILLTLMSVWLIVSCGYFKGQQQNVPFEEVEIDNTDRDSTIYGICGDASTMNVLQLITDNGDTLNLGLMAARDNNRMFGGYSVGDRMAVLVNADSTGAVHVINMSALLGDWVTEDALGGGTLVGLSIKDGGIAERIYDNPIDFKSWRLVNGRLEFLMSRDDDGDYEETESFDLLVLGPDSLVYRADDDVYSYSRLRERRQQSDGDDDIKFDKDDLDDDFIF